MSEIFDLCKAVAAEGTVLLKNDENLLPLSKGTRLAVFGRMQTSYYRSGTGSGGGVALREIPCILNSLKANSDLVLDENLINIYTEWVKKNPFDDGGGVWAGEPWHQKEMPVSDELVQNAALNNDVALVIIGRTAGEDHDNADVEGSYRLTEAEEDMLSKVSSYFKRIIVALNVGNVIDLSFIDKYSPQSVLYIWQGGMQGANAFAEILSGKMYPSGKLSDTQVYSLNEHPTNTSFGKTDKIIYDDDIYVGYRYFETFAKENVRYPFGYGLSYAEFDTSYSATSNSDFITINANVKNIGNFCGKEIIQVYFEAPESDMGSPSRQLVEFAKTKELAPCDSDELTLRFPINRMAAFDDTGITGNKSAYVLLKGDYRIYVGTDVRNAKCIFTYNVPSTRVIEQLSSAMAPYVDLDVIKAEKKNDDYVIGHRSIKGQTANIESFKTDFEELSFSGDKNIKLSDVYEEKHSLDEFVAQLNDVELAALVCGEGICSPKVTAGAAGALGGLTESLSYYGIPACCVADGPSGIKISKEYETSLTPNGTMLACTWNTEIVEGLFEEIGQELKRYEVDSLLGPGLNIHRSPLCGRNFEYFSEDPYLSGKMGAYITRGIAEHGTYSTIKHLCCNNQEKRRSDYDVAVTERALREIYLKPFEIAVKEGKNVLIMTSYNSVNGFWSASNYELTAKILKGEWGFNNIVMTDWWAKCNANQGDWGSTNRLDVMVRSQNDLYMVAPDTLVKSGSVLNGLEKGTITRAQLQLSCKRILEWILKTNTFEAYIERGSKPKYPIAINADNMTEVDSILNVESDKDYVINIKSNSDAAFVFKLSSDLDSLAQLPISVKVDNSEFLITINGTEGAEIEVTRLLRIDWWKEHKITLSFSNAVLVKGISIKQ
ncbi:MAG: glycoside hydrolase family 3 protein [Clostridia bacterium]|nr:glycoside hydrolase family 3 protein [Clostridia bacterium]